MAPAGLTAGGEIAAGVGGVHLRERVGAILLALQPGLRLARLGLADDAAPALQADAVLAVELEVLPVLQGRGSRPRVGRDRGGSILARLGLGWFIEEVGFEQRFERGGLNLAEKELGS